MFTIETRTFILTGCREYLYISVCIWYEDSFTQMKRSNAHEVTLRAVLEMLFMCMSSFSEAADVNITATLTRASVWVANAPYINTETGRSHI